MHHIVAESIVPAAEKVTISDQHVVIVESLLGHMATSHVKESTGRQPPNSQQEAAATVQKRAAGHIRSKRNPATAMSGLPSQHASQETWKPPASTLAHRLAVIHPQRRGDVLAERVYPTKLTPLHGVDLVHPACAPHPANGVRTNQPQWVGQAT